MRPWVRVGLVLCLGAGVLVPALAQQPDPARSTVTLGVRVSPPVRAQVFWGRQLLGVTPLTWKRPRDSGPVDLVVRAQGFVPFHTRLNTFGDDGVSVKLTRETERSTLFGYRAPLPDAGGAPPDGGPPAADGGLKSP